jgi:hypothetical protein
MSFGNGDSRTIRLLDLILLDLQQITSFQQGRPPGSLNRKVQDDDDCLDYIWRDPQTEP